MTTPNYDLPFPTLGDQPNGPAAVQALAEATDTAIKSVDDKFDTLPAAIALGTIQDSIITTPKTYTVTFPAGRFASPPRVFTQVFDKQYCETSVESVTASGCQITVTSAGGTGGGSLIPRVYWMAVGS